MWFVCVSVWQGRNFSLGGLGHLLIKRNWGLQINTHNLPTDLEGKCSQRLCEIKAINIHFPDIRDRLNIRGIYEGDKASAAGLQSSKMSTKEVFGPRNYRKCKSQFPSFRYLRNQHGLFRHTSR